MNNILLGVFLVGAAATWSHFGYWLPASVSLSLEWRRRLLAVGGIAIMCLASGFAVGDIIGGRAQIARSPVQYATRLTGSAAHHHDLADPARFWGQVMLEGMFGILLGGSLFVLSRRSRPLARPVA